ncbi:carbohydrate ABC transporter permease [Gynuella sunshinyii]|uniref:ABC-type sugar transport system, permease component n=1 Tax=Gynuella sunshinyii YC6258 TaxID=1445510 RepID=A0A0C5W2S7_9GAMM|nr:sugar ABC transporter permease [Gynuella sunshinyii]AJQ96974.1 ABC-type sugar transport system, permease component [Gynuella sunshinyii YC6258]
MSSHALSSRTQTTARSSRTHARPKTLPWVLPVIIVLALFYLYPVFDVFRFAFTDATLLSDSDHYTLESIVQTLTRPDILPVLGVTFWFTAASVIGQQALGLTMAGVIVRGEKRRLRGTTLLRTTALVAWVVPGIAGGIIWKMLFSEAPFGGFNSMLRMIGVGPVQWLSDPHIAMWSVIVSNVWRGTAFSMVVMYAAMKSIDPVLYEAAEVDGASPAQRFFFITLPQLRTAILVNMILITIQTLNTFDAVISLTGGGPGRATEVLSLYTFNVVFRNYDLAGGSVLSIVMLLISMALAVVYAGFIPKEDQS